MPYPKEICICGHVLSIVIKEEKNVAFFEVDDSSVGRPNSNCSSGVIRCFVPLKLLSACNSPQSSVKVGTLVVLCGRVRISNEDELCLSTTDLNIFPASDPNLESLWIIQSIVNRTIPNT